MSTNTAVHGNRALCEQLRAVVGADRVRERASAAQLTTFGVGGPADWLVDVRSSEETPKILQIASRYDLQVTVLGGGSNVLIGDRGIRGLVIRARSGDVSHVDTGLVRSDAGVKINALVRWTINRGLAGLAAWAGTPGTVGGAVAGNAHFQSRPISEHVDRVVVAGEAGAYREVPVDEMEFGYDRSRIQRTSEIVLWAVFRVSPGDPEVLRALARASLTYRKQTQPLHRPSAGCVFQNPDPENDRLPPDVPASAGALIDRAGLKGFGIGGARISPTHANFIVNEGGATAQDVLGLIDACKRAVVERFGVELREEIVRFGDF